MRVRRSFDALNVFGVEPCFVGNKVDVRGFSQTYLLFVVLLRKHLSAVLCLTEFDLFGSVCLSHFKTDYQVNAAQAVLLERMLPQQQNSFNHTAN